MESYRRYYKIYRVSTLYLMTERLEKLKMYRYLSNQDIFMKLLYVSMKNSFIKNTL